MTPDDTCQILESSTLANDNAEPLTNAERCLRLVERQSLFLSLALSLIAHFFLVLASHIIGASELWFSLSVSAIAQILSLFGFFFLLMQGFNWLIRKSQEKSNRLHFLAMRDAESMVSAISEQNIRIQQESVHGFAKISEARDLSSGQHIQRMKEYARIIAQSLIGNPKFQGIVDNDFVLDIYISAPLHDIGKVGTKDEILKKRGKLSGEEFELMKMHTIVGGDLMAELEDKLPRTTFFSRGREIAYHHHQRWDGTGYPNILSIGGTMAYFVEPGVGRPLKGAEIPLSARIVALADVYDALRSRRVYKEPFTHETARDMISQERGRHFDPDIVDAFLAIESEILLIAASFKD
jgi:response regulator RpfG family c-di-GMP phosphodiesterase